MPPRKKKPNSSSSSSSSRKSSIANHQAQPSKFGIQHFFERHSQNASQNLKNAAKPTVSPPNGAFSAPQPTPEPINVIDHDEDDPASENTKNRSHLKGNGRDKASQSTPPEGMARIGADAEASPEIFKSLSLKRLKFSPGMVNY